MEINQKFETILNPPLVSVPTHRSYKIAKWISRISSPPLLILVGLALASLAMGTSRAWIWAGFYLLIVVIVPSTFIIWKVRKGEITDFHMKIREQRIKPLFLSLVCTILGWVVLELGNAPSALVIFAGAGILQILFIFLVTLKWKISGHSAAIGGFAVFILALFGSAAAPVLLTIPLVAWARVRLNRHEVLQTIAGSLAGIFFMWGTIWLVICFAV
jgi:hypothetical protein